MWETDAAPHTVRGDQQLAAGGPPKHLLLDGQQRVTTLDGVTEFSRVVLADAGSTTASQRARLEALDETERQDAELRRHSLTYVAVTRTRDELTGVQPRK